GTQWGSAGRDANYADGVTDGFVEVPSNPGPLPRRREQPLALGLALRTDGATLQFGGLLVPQARSLAGEPRDGPDERGVKRDDRRKDRLDDADHGQITDEHSHNRCRRGDLPRGVLFATGGDNVERHRDAEGQFDEIAEAREQQAGGTRRHEHRQWKPPPDDEGKR